VLGLFITAGGNLSIVESHMADAPEIVSDPTGTASRYRRVATNAVVVSDEPQTAAFYEAVVPSEWTRGVREAREVEREGMA